MLNEKLVNELNERMRSLMGATPLRDLEKNFRAALGGAFGKLDLVTREEFDVQAEVLKRTREKLAALEARVTELEQASKRA